LFEPSTDICDPAVTIEEVVDQVVSEQPSFDAGGERSAVRQDA
jgi:hypothetical protein